MRPVPTRMANLERDARGYPVPFIVMRNADGKPNFVINDHELVIECARRDLCGICGGPLEEVRWFVGGVRNAFHRRGAYNDPPMHDECAHYALAVCPFLAVRAYRGANLEAATKRAAEPGRTFVDHTVVPGKPVMFVAVAANWTRPVLDRETAQVLYQPRAPFRKIEYWRDGEQLTFAEGRAIRDAVLSNALAPTVVKGGQP